MDLILGMDVGVFLAWIGTILVTILCVIYGVYYLFFKKTDEQQSVKKKQMKPSQEKEEK